MLKVKNSVGLLSMGLGLIVYNCYRILVLAISELANPQVKVEVEVEVED